MRKRLLLLVSGILALLLVAGLCLVLWPEAKVFQPDPPWSVEHELQLSSPIRSVAAGTGDRLFAIVEEGAIYCFDEHATELWQVELDPPGYGTLEVGPRGELLVRSGEHTYCFERDGKQHWCFNSERIRTTAPATSADGAEYLVEDRRKLIALKRNGTVAWEIQPAAEPLEYWGDLTVTTFPQGGRFYFSDGQQSIWSIKADGTDMRHLDQATGYIVHATLDGDGNCLLLAATPDRHDAEERLYCCGPDGALRWTYDGYHSLGSLALLEDGSMLLSAADYFDEGRFGIIKLNDAGKLLWSYFEQARPFDDWICPLLSGSSWLLFSSDERRVPVKGLAQLRQRMRSFVRLDTSDETWVETFHCITIDAEGKEVYAWKGSDLETFPQFSIAEGLVQIGVTEDRLVWFSQRRASISKPASEG